MGSELQGSGKGVGKELEGSGMGVGRDWEESGKRVGRWWEGSGKELQREWKCIIEWEGIVMQSLLICSILKVFSLIRYFMHRSSLFSFPLAHILLP